MNAETPVPLKVEEQSKRYRVLFNGQTLADSALPVDLASLEPAEVFRRLYRRSHDGDPEPDLMAAFHELLTGVQETM